MFRTFVQSIIGHDCAAAFTSSGTTSSSKAISTSSGSSGTKASRAAEQEDTGHQEISIPLEKLTRHTPSVSVERELLVPGVSGTKSDSGIQNNAKERHSSINFPNTEKEKSSNVYTFLDGVIVNFNYIGITKDSNVDYLFVEGDVWQSRELLFKAARTIANKQGFTVIRNSNRIECNRVGTGRASKQHLTERKMRGGALKTGCTWQIRISSLDKTLCNEGKKYRTDKFHEASRVKIIKACCDHTNCTPSAQNKNITAKRAGEYIKHIPQQQLWSLVMTMKNNNLRLSSSHIKGALRACFPKTFIITKQHVNYTRLKAWRLYKILGDDPQYDIFEQSMSNPEIETSINNESITDDEAVAMANAIWIDLIASHDFSDSNDNILFLEYLEMISEKANGFSYRLARDGNGNVVGAVWQTATMRSNFELFGDYVCLDSMQRKLNQLHWPYISLTMRNEMEQVCVGAEGIVASEREEAYEFLLNFIVDNSPGRDKTKVYVLSGDGFFTQKMVHDWGFENTHFVNDHWHLFESVLPRRFPKKIYPLIADDLRRMAMSSTESEFDSILSSAMNMLINLSPRNLNAEEELRKFASERCSYAVFELQKIKGNRNLISSTPAEQNHSSVLSHLNDGNKSSNNYYEAPETLIKDLFARQDVHIKKWNQCLAFDNVFLEHEIKTTVDATLKKAATTLCKLSYEKFKERYHKTSKYFCKKINSSSVAVYSHLNPNGEPHILSSVHEQCCSFMWSDNEQCVHHIAAYGFQPSVYEKRHFRRQQVTVSLIDTRQQTKIQTNIANVIDEGTVINKQCETALQEQGTTQKDASSDREQYELPIHESSDISNQRSDNAKIKPLTSAEFMKLVSDLSHTYSRSSSEKQIVASTMIFNVKDILCNKLPSKDNHDIETDCKSYETVLEKSKEILTMYRTAFAQSTQFKTAENAVVLRVSKPNESEVNTRLRSRPLSMKEKAVRRKKATRNCTFCKSSNPYSHDRNSCPRRIQYERQGTQYMTSNDKTNLRNRMESIMPILHPVKDPVINEMNSILISKVRHLIIHRCYATKRSNRYGILNIVSMNFEVSFVDQNGIIPTQHERQFISGYIMEDLLSAFKRSDNRLIFDETSHLQPDGMVLFHRHSMEIEQV